MRRLIFILTILLVCNLSHAADGLVVKKSPFTVLKTTTRLEKALKVKGMHVFARIDHAANAQKAGLKLRPAIVVIFGNPKIGTKLMQCAQTVAIDLPQKILIWKDAGGQVWIGYNDPFYLSRRHHLKGCDPVLKKINDALNHFIDAAVSEREPK